MKIEESERQKGHALKNILSWALEHFCLCYFAHLAHSGYFFHLHRVSGSTWCSEQNLPLSGVCLGRTWWILAGLYWYISHGYV